MGKINTLHQIFKRWKKRFFSLELPNRPRDSKTWLISLKRLLMPRVVKISPLMRETFCPLDSRTLSDPREEPSVPLVLLSKTQKFGDALSVYKKKIETELYTQCMLIVNIVKDNCLALAAEDESKAFFQKMIGDYYRYVAESATEATLEEVKQGALKGYEEADKLSKGLNACNPIRLGLALNFSVFHYEVMNDHKKACELGEAALSEALEKIDDVDEETFRDAKSIIELLKENLSLWKEEEGDNAVEDL